jgi:plastocyanin
MIGARRLLAGVSVLVGLTACGGSGGAPSSTGASIGNAGVNLGAPIVEISAVDAMKFVPGKQSARVGDVIQWKNTGTITHTITFDSNQSLNDTALDPGGTWQVKFSAAGTYQYHCSIHANMNGTITVT